MIIFLVSFAGMALKLEKVSPTFSTFNPYPPYHPLHQATKAVSMPKYSLT